MHRLPFRLLSPALLCAGGVLLAGCSTAPRAVSAAAGATPAAPSASSATFVPRNVKGYRVDAAHHLYGKNRERIYAGVLPHYLRAVGVLEMAVDAQGHITTLRWLRAPEHAPEVMSEIERLVLSSAPFPVPTAATLQDGSARVIETWLWDRSGKFQLRTLSEGQGESVTPPLLQAAPKPLPAPPVPATVWQPVRVHLVAADGR